MRRVDHGVVSKGEAEGRDGGRPEYDLILEAQLSGSFTPRVELVNWSQVSSGLRCCSLFFRLSDPMSGRWRRWLLGGRGAKGLPVGYVKHTQSLSPSLGDYDQQSMSHTCTGQHNGNSPGQ